MNHDHANNYLEMPNWIWISSWVV